MNLLRRTSLRALPALALALALSSLAARPALAQGVTTGALGGRVVAASDGSPLPGVTVDAVHTPTGTRYTAVTRADGRWAILNVRVGGPYTVRASLDGFRAQSAGDVAVELGETTDVDFKLQTLSVSEEVTVTADVEPLITPDRTGVAANLPQAAIEKLPNLDRSLSDLARTSPFFTTVGDNDQETIITVAGRNNRYNNIQIDGAVNNDLFGLAGSGTPGGQAETQPISLDAIKEVSLLVSPYDVRQGGFTGGGINAITRSGSNRLKGSGYWFSRDQSLVGNGPNDTSIADFSENEYGFRLGGPIVKDKLFFFLNGERFKRSAPSGISADGSSGTSFQNPAGAAEFRSILVNTYGYDPGGLGEATKRRNNDKIFARLDWNLAPGQQLTLRHNFVKADDDIYRPSAYYFDFPDRNYAFTDQTHSTVLQLNSTFGPDLVNEGRLTYQTIKDRRSGAQAFPAVSVILDDGSHVSAGTEPFSTKNALDQDILEITDDLTRLAGHHTITVGTHNELFSFNNLFIAQAFGQYEFLGLDNFRAGKARSFNRTLSLTGDPNQSAKFKVRQVGLYAGDEWAATDSLTLTYGLRVDAPYFPDDPTYNPDVAAAFGIRTDRVPSGNEVWSPRVGFNWHLPGGRSGGWDQQLRGGVGVFAGRTPYVWISNQYGNTGVEFRTIRSYIPDYAFDPTSNFIQFRPDPFGQPSSADQVGGTVSSNEINYTDPSFQFPQVMRTTLGYDATLPWWGLTLTAEGIYSNVLKEVQFVNVNEVPTGRATFDGRPVFTTANRDFGNVIELKNTNRGHEWNTAIKLSHPYRKGLYGYVSWLYGQSKVVTDATSSRAISNWAYLEVQGNPNDPTLSTSDFDPGNRFNASLAYTFDLGPTVQTVSLFYNAQSGRPYSTTFSNDINGDFQTNDLLYVPASADEVIIDNGTFADLEHYIQSDSGLRDAQGSIVARNASRAPWIHQLDVHYGIQLPFGSWKPEVTLDVFNFGNLIDSSSGVVRIANFSEVSPVRLVGIDQATGKPIYHLNFTDPDRRFFVDDLRSRWQAKLGLRLSF